MSVTGYIGLPGSGKTLELVARLLKAREQGRDVYANFMLGSRQWGVMLPDASDPRGYRFEARADLADKKARKVAERLGLRVGRGFVRDPGAHLLTSWDQIVALRVMRDEFGMPHRTRLEEQPDGTWESVRDCAVYDCAGCSKGVTVGIDELNLWAPSRLWQDMGIGVLNRWAYNRKDGLDILWSAQHEARVDKVAREVTDFIWACNQVGGELSIFGRKLQLRVFHRAKWVPALLSEKDRTDTKEGVRPTGMLAWEFSLFHKRVAEAYDTYEHVAVVHREKDRPSRSASVVELRPASARGEARAARGSRGGAAAIRGGAVDLEAVKGAAAAAVRSTNP